MQIMARCFFTAVSNSYREQAKGRKDERAQLKVTVPRNERIEETQLAAGLLNRINIVLTNYIVVIPVVPSPHF